MNTDQMQWLRQRIDEGPRPEDGVCVLRGKEIQRIIAEQFNVTYSLSAVYKLLHRGWATAMYLRDLNTPKAICRHVKRFKKSQ